MMPINEYFASVRLQDRLNAHIVWIAPMVGVSDNIELPVYTGKLGLCAYMYAFMLAKSTEA